MATTRSSGTKLDPESNEQLTAADWAIIDNVNTAMRDGWEVYQWWLQASASDPPAYDHTYTLIGDYHGRGETQGFRSMVDVAGKRSPFIGVDQHIFFDHIRPLGSTATKRKNHMLWVREQLREFVMGYYQRVMKLPKPQNYPQLSEPDLPDAVRAVSGWPNTDINMQGFGCMQFYYNKKNGGGIGKFDADEQFKVIDLRSLEEVYEWIVMQFQFFKFGLDVQPLGRDAPQMNVIATQTPYLVTNKDWIIDRTYDWDKPKNGSIIAEYGPGYAFVAHPEPALVTFGPNRAQPAFDSLYFELHKDGKIMVRSIFAIPDVKRILNVPLNPVQIGFDMADLASFGYASKFLAPAKKAFDQLPGSNIGFDPIMGSLRLGNLMTGGLLSSQLCLNKDMITRYAMLIHSNEIGEEIAGARRTWGLGADWTNPETLPEWVKTGRITLAATKDGSGPQPSSRHHA